jgi:hypothetical protein
MSKLVYADWVKVFEKAFSVPSQDGFLSMRQLRERTGLGDDALNRRVNRGLDEGWIVFEKRLREGRRGGIQPTFVYKIDSKKFKEIF